MGLPPLRLPSGEDVVTVARARVKIEIFGEPSSDRSVQSAGRVSAQTRRDLDGGAPHVAILLAHSGAFGLFDQW